MKKIILTLILLFPVCLFAVKEVSVDENLKSFHLGKYLEYYEDKEAKLTITDISSAEFENSFKSSTKEELGFGYSRSAYWVRFKIFNKSEKDLKLFLENRYAQIDYIHFYTIDEDGQIEKSINGDRYPLSQKGVKYRNPTMILNLKANKKYSYYVRFQTESSINFSFLLWNNQDFIDHTNNDLIVQGIYVGTMLVMFIFNFFLYITIRDVNYLCLVLFIAAETIFMTSLNGLTSLYIFTENTYWGNNIVAMSGALAVLTTVIFSRRFILTPVKTPKINVVLNGFIVLSIIATIISTLGYYFIGIKLAALLGLTMCPVLLAVGIISSKNRYKPAIYYTIAWSFYLFGSIILLAKALDVVQFSSDVAIFTQQVGSTFVVLFLSFALGNRINMLTESKVRAEEETSRVMEIDKQKTQFFQNVSHEIRTPLTLIMNPLESIREKDKNNEQIEIMHKNTQRLYRLVNQLLDFQKISSDKLELKMKAINLNDFIYNCMGYFKGELEKKKIDFRVSIGLQEETYISADIDAFEKIIFNYVSNAYKYTPEGGKISLSIKKSGSNVRVLITDTGPGISKKDQGKLFKTFSQVDGSTSRNYEGSGLGLSLASELAGKMNGSVGVESSEGSGSTFWVEFPVLGKPKEVLDLLVVDDELESLDALERLFIVKMPTVKFIRVANPEDALKEMKNNSFRCILSDYVMPGMDGIKLLKHTLEKYPNTSRLLMSGEADKEVITEAINLAKVEGVILKPYNSNDLIKVLQEAIDKSPLTGEESEEDSEYKIKDWLLDKTTQTVEPEKTEVSPLDMNKKTILVVDDNRDMRSVISTILEKNNLNVITAQNGNEGLSKAREHRPDVIILDWMMPKKSGVELIKDIKGDVGIEHTPTILLTAKNDEESKLIGTKTGASAYIGKPFDELELLSTVENLIDLKKGEEEIKKLNRELSENVLKRFLPPSLVDSIVEGKEKLDDSFKSANLTILFSDITGFSKISSEIGPKNVAKILNEYLNQMSEVIYSFDGTIDKIIGDSMMVLWGAPKNIRHEDGVLKAYKCSLKMQEELNNLNMKWKKEGLTELKARIGIHHGSAIVGYFGGKRRLDYTAIGTSINMAQRIEGVANPGEIFISSVVRDILPETAKWEKVGKFNLKGVSDNETLYRIIS